MIILTFFHPFLWGGYFSRIYPESTQELDQILGPFWFVYTAESPPGFEKKCKQIRINPESAQEVYQILGPVWFVYIFLKSWELSVV